MFLTEEENWRERDYDRSGYSYRGARGGTRYRGRGGRGARGAARGGFRPRHDPEYPDYPTDYTQVRACVYVCVRDMISNANDFSIIFFFEFSVNYGDQMCLKRNE